MECLLLCNQSLMLLGYLSIMTSIMSLSLCHISSNHVLDYYHSKMINQIFIILPPLSSLPQCTHFCNHHIFKLYQRFILSSTPPLNVIIISKLRYSKFPCQTIFECLLLIPHPPTRCSLCQRKSPWSRFLLWLQTHLFSSCSHPPLVPLSCPHYTL